MKKYIKPHTEAIHISMSHNLAVSITDQPADGSVILSEKFYDDGWNDWEETEETGKRW